MRFSRRAILSGAIAVMSTFLSQSVAAQTAFPTKPITHIVPAASGGPTDTVARLRDAKAIERFASLGTEPARADLAMPAALKAHLAAEVPRWGAVIEASGAKGN
jgi:tripartite-type tricarboxylate transporter receptor subunit TctC